VFVGVCFFFFGLSESAPRGKKEKASVRHGDAERGMRACMAAFSQWQILGPCSTFHLVALHIDQEGKRNQKKR
jgi:hypothetical protein